MAKKRLDVLLFEKGLSPSRERAKTTIMSGMVYVDGQKALKPGTEVADDARLEVRDDPIGFVSRGGLKLEKALREFAVDPRGREVIDCGASTGGFTDCLLKHGASHVWAIDVGYGQLAWALRNDERVTCMERFNIRNLTKDDIDASPDLAVIDLSFISLKLALPPLARVLQNDCEVICLVKPQFETEREKVGKNGVVRDPAVHEEVLARALAHADVAGMAVKGISFSPIRGPKGNIEFLAHLVRPAVAPGVSAAEIKKTVAAAHAELKVRKDEEDSVIP